MRFLQHPFPEMKAKTYQRLAEYGQLAVIILIMACFFLNFRVACVPSLSMYPTLDVNEYLFCMNTSEFQYGDIVIFHPYPNSSTTYVKRVIGKEGDTIAVKDGMVWRNGEALTEKYIAEPIEYEMDEITVPDGTYFLMGDNRNNSSDSHVLGPIDEDSIYAKVLFHFNPVNWIKNQIA